jgi:anion-transporting  ArsA/GET3 family ATPase
MLVVQQQPDERHPHLDVTADYRPVELEPRLELSSVDGRSALKEYVHRTMLLPGLYDWFIDGAALKHFTEAAPGFEELMCLGKLYDLVTDTKYEQVVFDAPSTGHAALMLRVPRATVAAVRTGPLHHNAVKIQSMLENDRQTRIVIVALPEEMAIREASELASLVRDDLAMHLGPLVVNRTTAQLFDREEIDALDRITSASATLTRMIGVARARFARATTDAEYVAALRRERPWVIEQPHVVLARHEPAKLIDAIAANVGAAFEGLRRE